MIIMVIIIIIILIITIIIIIIIIIIMIISHSPTHVISVHHKLEQVVAPQPVDKISQTNYGISLW